MLFISSYTVTERDKTQKMLYQEREEKLKEQIHYQKEALFAKRIYHTHHKAEKIMGFIKNDLKQLYTNNKLKRTHYIESINMQILFLA